MTCLETVKQLKLEIQIDATIPMSGKPSRAWLNLSSIGKKFNSIELSSIQFNWTEFNRPQKPGLVKKFWAKKGKNVFRKKTKKKRVFSIKKIEKPEKCPVQLNFLKKVQFNPKKVQFNSMFKHALSCQLWRSPSFAPAKCQSQWQCQYLANYLGFATNYLGQWTVNLNAAECRQLGLGLFRFCLQKCRQMAILPSAFTHTQSSINFPQQNPTSCPGRGWTWVQTGKSSIQLSSEPWPIPNQDI